MILTISSDDDGYLIYSLSAVEDPAVCAVGAGEGRGEAEAEGDPLASGYTCLSPSLPMCGPLPFGYFDAEGGSLARWGVSECDIPSIG
jgi:hypothetical protein